MTRSADSTLASSAIAALGVAGLAGLTVITLASPGATRMFAWPWSLAYAVALLAPAVIFLARAFDPHRPLLLPPAAWRFSALALAAVIVASALASPWRGPSLLASAPLLAAIALYFVLYDFRRADPPSGTVQERIAAVGLAAILSVSFGLWLASLAGRSFAEVVAARNPFPLGHSNYTAGLTLLALPLFGALAWRATGLGRAAWIAAVALALVLLVSSGSRAAIPALGVLGFATLLVARLPRRRKFFLVLALPVAALAIAAANPRTRAMLLPADPAAAPNPSNVQRAAMLATALHMAGDRPLLGHGAGSTPLAYPRYRGLLDGGAENVLQLHSTPAQLLAELGTAGLGCALVLAALALRTLFRRTAPSGPALALVGYAVFALADWQFDVPIFGFVVACCLAVMTPDAAPAAGPGLSRALGLGAACALGLVAAFGRSDPTPALNVRALALARTAVPAATSEAVALLHRSLALNPDQEIAHFNLGWLLLVSDPAAAERHFTAALRLVPDKGGVYFGLGLARLNLDRPGEAARAFALECLNDPAFAFSPWWREPALAALAPATRTAFAQLAALAGQVGTGTPLRPWAASQLPGVAALAPRIGEVPPGPLRTYRRERTGYPVLTRNPDLPAPLDLFDVREPLVMPAGDLPPKGWLPSPLLLTLLDAAAVPPPRS